MGTFRRSSESVEKSRRLLGFLLLVLLAGTGCQSTSRHDYGDAQVYRTDVHCSLFLAVTPAYRMEFPKVSLAKQESHVLHVRGMPRELTNYVVPVRLYMKLPQRDHSGLDREDKGRVLPWMDAVVSFEAHATNGPLLHAQTLRLGDLEWHFEASRYFGWHLSTWLRSLAESVRGKNDYDLTVRIISPSLRKRDFIQLTGSPLDMSIAVSRHAP